MNSLLFLVFLSMLTTILVENVVFKILFSCLTVILGVFYVRILEKNRKVDKKSTTH